MECNPTRFVRCLKAAEQLRSAGVAYIMEKDTKGSPWADTQLATIFLFLGHVKRAMQAGK